MLGLRVAVGHGYSRRSESRTWSWQSEAGANGFQFVVAQYRDFLDRTLRPFEVLRGLATGALPSNAATLRKLAHALDGHDFGDNDWRTLSYFYFVAFRDFLLREEPDLIFGTLGSGEADENQGNMLWRAETNLQGPPVLRGRALRPGQPPDTMDDP